MDQEHSALSARLPLPSQEGGEDEGARWRRWTRSSRSGAELLVVRRAGELSEQGSTLLAVVHRPPKCCAEQGSW